MEEYASQLTQEVNSKNSQILALNTEVARLSALLEATSAASNPSIAANPTRGVESQSHEVTTSDKQHGGAYESDKPGNRPQQRSLGGDNNPMPPTASTMKPNNSTHESSLSDDDEDQIPRPKDEKVSVPDAAKKAVALENTTTAAAARKRKRADEPAPSTLSEKLRGLGIGGSNARSQRLPTRNHPAIQEPEVPLAKRSRPAHASASSSRQEATDTVKTPIKKRTKPPHRYTPLRESPFKNLIHPTPPSPSPAAPTTPTPNQFPSTFRLPPGSGRNYGGDNQTTTEANENTTTSESSPDSTYAEMIPFAFKFVGNYANRTGSRYTNLKVTTATMHNTPSVFWNRLSPLSEKWEEQAGAYWAWEFQKRSSGGRVGGEDGMPRRYCITSRLAKRRTRWRPEDNGFWACMNCTEAARPCFTWITDIDGGYGNGEDAGEVFGAPKGEFWCLPVHADDRRCEIVEGVDIRTWVNGKNFGVVDHCEEESEKSVGRAEDEYDDNEGFDPEGPPRSRRRKSHRRASVATLIVVLKLPKEKLATIL